MKCLLHLYRFHRRPFLKDDRVYYIHPKSKTKEWRQSMLSLSTAETGDILQDLKKETIRTERITITSVHTCTSAKTCGIRKYVISLCHNQEDSKRFPRRRKTTRINWVINALWTKGQTATVVAVLQCTCCQKRSQRTKASTGTCLRPVDKRLFPPKNPAINRTARTTHLVCFLCDS